MVVHRKEAVNPDDIRNYSPSVTRRAGSVKSAVVKAPAPAAPLHAPAAAPMFPAAAPVVPVETPVVPVGVQKAPPIPGVDPK